MSPATVVVPRSAWLGLESHVRQHRGDPPLDGVHKYESEELPMPVASISRCLVVTLLSCLLGLCACSGAVDPAELAGTYEAHTGDGVEKIELRRDGTYSEHFTSVDGVSSTYSNTWKFEPFGGEPKVALEGFASHFPESPKGDVMLLGAEEHWGGTRLYESYIRDQYYVRVASN
jgi:hypothetical protein